MDLLTTRATMHTADIIPIFPITELRIWEVIKCAQDHTSGKFSRKNLNHFFPSDRELSISLLYHAHFSGTVGSAHSERKNTGFGVCTQILYKPVVCVRFLLLWQNPRKRQLREEGFILAHSLYSWSLRPMCGEAEHHGGEKLLICGRQDPEQDNEKDSNWNKTEPSKVCTMSLFL